MKLFLIGTLLFSGGTAVAMQNEEVRESTVNMYKNVRERVAKRVAQRGIENVKENGFPYPSEERLENLTEDQQIAILTTIDQFNATYDWANMTDEEIKDALESCKEELDLLFDEIGLEVPDNWAQKRFRKRVNERTKDIIKGRLIEDLKEDGLEYPHEEFLVTLTEEQQDALLAKIDELNATYDWVNMTDEEILDAMVVVRDELRSLHEEFGIVPPHPHHERPAPEEPVTEDTDEEVL